MVVLQELTRLRGEKNKKGETTHGSNFNETTIEAGVHFGRKLVAGTLRWLKYIFTERNRYVIDLQQTVKYADQAYDFMRDAAANDAVILFVKLPRNKLLMLLQKLFVQVNISSTTVGWVELLLTGEQSKNVSARFERNQTHGRRMEQFFLRKVALLNKQRAHHEKFIGRKEGPVFDQNTANQTFDAISGHSISQFLTNQTGRLENAVGLCANGKNVSDWQHFDHF